jgi:hypothetical protein
MMDTTEIAAAELLLQDADFPDNYINMQHPDDYSVLKQPFIEYITNTYAHHYRLIIRACWKLSEDEYMPMSFVCDTGAPTALYLSEKAYKILSKHRRVLEDDAGNVYANICGTGPAAVEPTPPGHAPANIIGLKLLLRLGLDLDPDKSMYNSSFVLKNMPFAL